VEQDSRKAIADERPETLRDRFVALVRARRAEQGLLVLGILYTFYFARSLILPIFIALLFAALLQPLVQKLNRFHIPDSLGAAIVVVVFFCLLALAVSYLSGPAAKWLDEGPAAVERIQSKVAKLKTPIQHAKEATEGIGKVTDLGGKDSQKKVAVKEPSVAGHIVSRVWEFLGEAAVVIILIYFFLAQGRTTLERVTNGFRDPSQGERVRTVLLQAQKDISAYLRTYAVINSAITVVVTLLMFVLGLPTPYLWGVMAGCLNFIPYLGPATALGVIALVSLLTFDSLTRVLLPPLLYLALIILEGNFITPMIMSNRLSMNAIAVFLSILFWGWVWGVPGVFLAVPILATLKIIFNTINAAKPIREALK
jgi:predicted PurR-regulated permease PerM